MTSRQGPACSPLPCRPDKIFGEKSPLSFHTLNPFSRTPVFMLEPQCPATISFGNNLKIAQGDRHIKANCTSWEVTGDPQDGNGSFLQTPTDDSFTCCLFSSPTYHKSLLLPLIPTTLDVIPACARALHTFVENGING